MQVRQLIKYTSTQLYENIAFQNPQPLTPNPLLLVVLYYHHLPLQPFSLAISSSLARSLARCHSLSILCTTSSPLSPSPSPIPAPAPAVGLSQPLRPINRPHLLRFVVRLTVCPPTAPSPFPAAASAVVVYGGIHAGYIHDSSVAGSVWWYQRARESSCGCVSRWYCSKDRGNSGCGRPVLTLMSGTSGVDRCDMLLR
jgi:hypothetical protein